jgi:hypothetical protein
MAQSYVSGANAYYRTTASATSRTITAGSGWQADDILLLLLVTDESSVTFSLPTGWTQIGTTVTDTAFAAMWGWVRHTGSTPSLAFGVGTTSSRSPEAHILCFRGCHVTSPIAGNAQGVTASMNNGTACDPPAVAAGTNNLVVTMAARRLEWPNTAVPGAPTGYTFRSTQDAGPTFTSNIGVIAVSDALLSGTQDPGTWSGHTTGTAIGWHGATLALAVADSGSVTGLPGVGAATLASPGLAMGFTINMPAEE